MQKHVLRNSQLCGEISSTTFSFVADSIVASQLWREREEEKLYFAENRITQHMESSERRKKKVAKMCELIFLDPCVQFNYDGINMSRFYPTLARKH